MGKVFFIVTLFAAFIIFYSCSKETASKNTKASEYFPNSLGDYWEYNVKRTTTGYLDKENYTVKVTIVGTQKLIDGNNASIWQYQYPSGNDTNYVTITKDTVKVYDPFRIETLRGLQFPLKIYLIPFQDGKRWDGKLLLIDSSHVTNAPTVSTKFETFKDCFSIYHYYLAPNTEYIDTIWFKPNIGFIKNYYNHYVLAPPTTEVWELQKYLLH